MAKMNPFAKGAPKGAKIAVNIKVAPAKKGAKGADCEPAKKGFVPFGKKSK